jgi:transposase
MIFGLGPATRIFIALEPVDMRKGFEGLYGLVRDHLGEDPLSGHLFLFANRAHTRLKALVWDGSGLWVCAKRLERGSFHWPKPQQAEQRDDAAGGTGDADQRHGSDGGAAPRELVSAVAFAEKRGLKGTKSAA